LKTILTSAPFHYGNTNESCLIGHVTNQKLPFWLKFIPFKIQLAAFNRLAISLL